MLVPARHGTQMKADAGKKADDVKGKRTELDRAQKDLEPLQRQLEELRKAARGQVSKHGVSCLLCRYHMVPCGCRACAAMATGF